MEKNRRNPGVHAKKQEDDPRTREGPRSPVFLFRISKSAAHVASNNKPIKTRKPKFRLGRSAIQKKNQKSRSRKRLSEANQTVLAATVEKLLQKKQQVLLSPVLISGADLSVTLIQSPQATSRVAAVPAASSIGSPWVTGKALYRSNQRDFWPGAIITAPHHVTALDPGAHRKTNGDFVQGKSALICSKRRLMIVLWAYGNESLFALPLTTKGKSGLANVPKAARKDFLYVVTKDARSFDNLSPHAPLSAKMFNQPHNVVFGEKSVVNVTASVTVNYSELIQVVGKIGREDFGRLMTEFVETVDSALRANCRSSQWKDGRYGLQLEYSDEGMSRLPVKRR